MPSYYTGKVINGYEIIDCITLGNFATSYIVRKGGREYFLKEYTDPTESCPDFFDFVNQQDKINNRLTSTGLKCFEKLIEFFVLHYKYHQVKELYECVDLSEYLESNSDLEDRMYICRLWLGILKQISSVGIVQQDLKPQQILMVKDRNVKLNRRMIFADFDWAIIDGKMIRPVHTPGYATPEALTNKIPKVSSDLYQTGIIFYQILTGGLLPFYVAGELYDVEIIKERMYKEQFELPHIIQPVVPEWCSLIIKQMLSWDESNRPSIDDVIDAWDHKKPLKAYTKSVLAKTPVSVSKPISTKVLSTIVPDWIRLKHSSGANISFASDTQVTRDLFHKYFRNVKSPTGNFIAAYFPSDNSPLFSIKKEATGWKIYGGSHRNYALLKGVRLEQSKGENITNGDKLEIFSRNDSCVIAEFLFEVP